MLLESGITIFIEPSGWVNSVTGPILLVTLQTSCNTYYSGHFLFALWSQGAQVSGISSTLLIVNCIKKGLTANEITYLMLSDFIIAFFLLCLYHVIAKWLLQTSKSRIFVLQRCFLNDAYSCSSVGLRLLFVATFSLPLLVAEP